MSAIAIPHAAGEVLVHGIDWTPWLDHGDALASSSVAGTGDLSVDASAVPDTLTTSHFVVAGGTSGAT